MENTNNEQDSRTGKYTESNDRLTEMTEMQRCMKKLEEKGYNDQFRVEKKIPSISYR